MTRKAARQTRPTLEELEPRILFSGDALFQDTTNDQLAAECIDYDLIEASCAKEKPSVHDEEKQELVIIDAGVEDIDRILADFSEQNQKHFELLVLDSNRDGISQITELLKQKSKLDVVHIISHGNNATLQLGNTQLDKESLQSHASAIARWSDALTADADILIYGCDVAADAEGKQLLNELALLTGADIAASTDLTGHSALGGDWDLEFSIGEINSDIAPSQHLQQSYAATLVNLTPDVELDNGNLSWQLNSLSTSRDGAHDVFAADIDGDGDIDIAGAADVDDSLVWYENDGNGNFIEHLITDSEDGVISVEVADMDNDGDMDMVSAGRFNDTVAVWINDGNQNFTRNVAASNINIAFSVHAIDVDGDGLKDIVFSENGESNTGVGGRLGWLEQNDNGTFTQHFIDTTVNAQVTNNVETTQGADIDGDGDIDIIAALDVDTDFVWYENDGSQNFTKHVFDNNANNALDIKAFDIDQDGDMDMAGVVFLDGTLYWYENDGSQNFTRHEVSNTLDQAQTVNIADIDGDGDYDLLTASSGSDQLRWYENDGSQNFTEHFISAGSDGGESAVAADLNGDNVLDLIFASRTDGQYSAYINPTKTVWTNIGDGSNERQLPIDLSVSDAEATDLIVSLSVSNGTLSIDDTLVTITDGANNSSSIEIEASISNLNSTLDTLIYESDLHYLGADTLDIEVQDNLDHATANPTDTVFIVLSSLPITVQAGNTLTVTTSSDIDDGNTSSIGALLTDMGADGEISLREAIIATNNTQNGDVVDRILFDLPNAELIDPGGSNHWEINLDSELPEITDAVTINALASGSTDVRISIKGDNAGTDANGFSISASDTSIRGLNIQGFDGAGIHIHAGSNQRLERNFIGTDITGENAAANNIGILLNGTAGSVTIGSDNRDLGNLVSGNTGDGIHIRDADANTIKSNLIGTNLAGDADLGNGGYGIHLRDASNNNIGANTAVRNIISGNGEGGLDITFDSSNNTVRGNFIGTDLTGTAAIGNTDDGITISDGADNNTIGGDRSNNEGNVLSGNSNDGIEIEHNGTDGNLIFGNYIGVDSSGESALANGRHGISLFNGISNTVVGGASDGRGNVIAGNSTNGIIIDGWTDSDTANNKIIGNFIGTDVGATLDLGNGDKGIRIFGQANNNQIGGINSNEGNIIANNTREGISISDDDADNNSILGNAIYNNGALDIDIGADGLSGNDNDDADSGANDGQNSAVIEDVTTVGANSSITGSLSSLASSN
jgi:parallel beta-helix repeat protein